MDEYKILFQGALPAYNSEATVYTCPAEAKSEVTKGSTVTTNPLVASRVTQTMVTSIVACNTRSSTAAANVTIFLYPDQATLTDHANDATYALVFLNSVASRTFNTYNFGLYMSPGSILTASGYLADTVSLNILGIETTV